MKTLSVLLKRSEKIILFWELSQVCKQTSYHAQALHLHYYSALQTISAAVLHSGVKTSISSDI